MNEQIIKAISFFYQGERHVIKAGKSGKFRVPVTDVIEGKVKTRVKGLTAQQMLEQQKNKATRIKADQILRFLWEKKDQGRPEFVPQVSCNR